MNDIWPYVLFHYHAHKTAQDLGFNVAETEGSVLLSYTDTLHLDWCYQVTSWTGSYQVVTKFSSIMPMGSNVFTISKKTQAAALNSQSATSHNKSADVMSLYPDSLTGLGKFQSESHHIEVDPNVSPKKRSCRPVPIHQEAIFKQHLAEMQGTGILKAVDNALLWINSL